MAPTFTAVYDACVLFPFTLRDILVQLATTQLFRARWSNHIHDEWTQAILRDQPHLDVDKVRRVRELMDNNVLDSVVTGYEPLIDGLELPDPDDRHVLAAAIRCGADVIVTKNLADFPAAALQPFGIEAQHPDQFITYLVDLNSRVVANAVQTCRLRLKNPPKDCSEYTDLIRRNDLNAVAEWLATLSLSQR